MKKALALLSLLTAASIFAFAGCFKREKPDETVYELRIYTTHPGKLDALLARFRDHTCDLFERHGMTNVAYFTPAAGEAGAGVKLFYLLKHDNREKAAASFAAFLDDPDWKKAYAESIVDGKLVAHLESTFLATTDYSGEFDNGNAGANRVFEMRIYKTLPGRRENLDARFRDHTCALFDKHGMTNLGYFHPVDIDKGADNTLIYLLAHDSREAADASWASFRADPDWIDARTASEKDGKILQPNGVTRVFLAPTDFSAVK